MVFNGELPKLKKLLLRINNQTKTLQETEANQHLIEGMIPGQKI
jgi:hypothetical protein